MRQRLERAILAIYAAIQPRVVDGDGDARSDQLQQRAVLLAISVQARGLQIDDAHQFAAREHRNGQFSLHGIQSRADSAGRLRTSPTRTGCRAAAAGR
jgi:hypothetical protein